MTVVTVRSDRPGATGRTQGRGAGGRRDIVAMTAVVGALMVLGWGGLIAIVSSGLVLPGAGYGIGLGWAVFALGMRHAFDADHIAAIDNTTRSLTKRGQAPVTVGLWFSLGHSTVVIVACAALAGGVRLIASTMTGSSAGLRSAFSLVGTSVSAVFLIVIGIVNLVALIGLVTVLAGRGDDAAVEASLNRRGLIARLLGGRLARVAKPWHIFPVGLLFGLGFDTATEVGLFAISGGAATMALPWYAILVLPIVFAAGMALFDSLDGWMMGQAYSWAGADSARRRLIFNTTVTGLSVVLALVIGTVEALSILRDTLGWTSGPVGLIGGVDLDYLGYAAVAVFAVVWIAALVVTRRRRVGSAEAVQPGVSRTDRTLVAGAAVGLIEATGPAVDPSDIGPAVASSRLISPGVGQYPHWDSNPGPTD